MKMRVRGFEHGVTARREVRREGSAQVAHIIFESGAFSSEEVELDFTQLEFVALREAFDRMMDEEMGKAGLHLGTG